MLNLNYTLLSEGANSRYKIPSYRNYGHLSTYSEGYMITKITEFNQIMRECQVELSSIIPSDDPTYVIPVSEAGVAASIANGIKTIIIKAIEAVKNIFKIIRNFIAQSIKNISEKVDNAKYSKIEKMNSSERVKILRQVIYNTPSDQIPQFKICDLTITKDLLSNNFPNTKFIGSKLSKMTTDALETYVYSYERAAKDPSSYESEANSAESLANYLDDNTNTVLSGIFGNYAYDSTNPLGSAMEAAKKAFGSNEFDQDFKLSVDIYLKACDNISTIKDVVKNLEKELKEVEASEREIESCLNKAMNTSNAMLAHINQVKNYPNGIDFNAKFTEITKKMAYNLSRIMLFVRQAIGAEELIIRHKALRAKNIYDVSNTIKKTCNRLINIQLGTDEESTNEAYDPSDDVRDAEMLEEQFESILCMTEEFWLENEYNQNIMQYITEADGTGASNPTAAPDASANPAPVDKADSVQTSISKTQGSSQNKAGDLGETLVAKFNQVFDRFRETFLKGSIMVDTNFWNRNRAKINSLGETIGKTNIADWYDYDINKLKQKLDTIKYDDSATYLNSDQEFQDFILSKFGSGNAKFTGDAANNSFSKKMVTVFYDNYIEKDKLTPLNGTKYNHDLAFGFINDCIRNGFNGEYLGSVRDDRKFINESLKTANKNIKNTEDKIRDDKTAIKTTTTTVSTTGTPSNDGGGNVQVTNNSAIDNSDFRFNLAEHFGLVVGEKVINLNELQTQVPDDLKQQSDDATGNKTAEQLAKARINRYFKYMTFAVSAKMTTELKAYKQYMGLFKSLYKGGNAKNNTQTTTNQNQQNTEQQQNQNPNTEGNK